MICFHATARRRYDATKETDPSFRSALQEEDPKSIVISRQDIFRLERTNG